MAIHLLLCLKVVPWMSAGMRVPKFVISQFAQHRCGTMFGKILKNGAFIDENREILNSTYFILIMLFKRIHGVFRIQMAVVSVAVIGSGP